MIFNENGIRNKNKLTYAKHSVEEFSDAWPPVKLGALQGSAR